MAVHQDMDIDSSNKEITTVKEESAPFDCSVLVIDDKQDTYPNEGSTCKVILISAEDTTEECHQCLNLDIDSENEIIIGNSENEIQDQVEQRLLRFKVGEIFKFNIFLENYNDKVFPVAVESENGNYELKLISFVNVSPINQLSSLEMLERAKHLKELGNKIFKDKLVKTAFRKYSRAMKFLILISDSLVEEDKELDKEYQTLKSQCYLNIAACQLQSKGFCFVAENCTKVLQSEPENVKALYRRAIAYKNMGDCEDSLIDLEKAYEIDSGNAAVKKEMLQLKSQLHNQNANLAKAMSKMFTG